MGNCNSLSTVSSWRIRYASRQQNARVAQLDRARINACCIRRLQQFLRNVNPVVVSSSLTPGTKLLCFPVFFRVVKKKTGVVADEKAQVDAVPIKSGRV